MTMKSDETPEPVCVPNPAVTYWHRDNEESPERPLSYTEAEHRLVGSGDLGAEFWYDQLAEWTDSLQDLLGYWVRVSGVGTGHWVPQKQSIFHTGQGWEWWWPGLPKWVPAPEGGLAIAQPPATKPAAAGSPEVTSSGPSDRQALRIAALAGLPQVLSEAVLGTAQVDAWTTHSWIKNGPPSASAGASEFLHSAGKGLATLDRYKIAAEFCYYHGLDVDTSWEGGHWQVVGTRPRAEVNRDWMTSSTIRSANMSVRAYSDLIAKCSRETGLWAAVAEWAAEDDDLYDLLWIAVSCSQSWFNEPVHSPVEYYYQPMPQIEPTLFRTLHLSESSGGWNLFGALDELLEEHRLHGTRFERVSLLIDQCLNDIDLARTVFRRLWTEDVGCRSRRADHQRRRRRSLVALSWPT